MDLKITLKHSHKYTADQTCDQKVFSDVDYQHLRAVTPAIEEAPGTTNE